MAIDRNKARSLCTATELALVNVSGPKSITQLSGAQLRQKVSRSRKLVDKWRDQSQRQRRDTQAKTGSRETSAAGRSAEKAKLFAEVLKRFEGQLAKADVAAEKSTAKPKRKESPRKTRNRQHRATRAMVRGDLAESRRELSAKKVAKRKPAGKAPAARVDGAAEAPVATPIKAPAKAPAKKGRAKGGAVVKASTAKAFGASSSESQPVISKGKQRRATTAAKQSRLQAAGIKRMQMHASARNKRNQAKRDSR